MINVPIVDLAAADAPDRLDTALRRLGFVQLVGHGVTEGEALWAAMDELFAQPVEVKSGWRCEDALSNRGYRMRGSEALAYSLGGDAPPAPDLFESYNLRPPGRSGTDELMAEPIWPDEVPSFRPAAEAYLSAMASLSALLDEIIGGLIGLDDLAARSTMGPDAMACIRYQYQPDEDRPVEGQARMGAHSDYTTFTVLRADPVPGLQILTDHWYDVVPEPGALMLNVGDLAAMWTNDQWPSTVHRVPLAGGGADPVLRRSVAYFHYPNLDVEVAPLDRFAGPGSARYQPTTVADHLRAKLVGPKLQTRSEGANTLADRTPDQP